VNGSHLVHIATNLLNDRMFVNLINVAGEHTNPNAIGYDEIPSIKDLTVGIRTTKKPAKILMQPEGREMKFDYENGVSTMLVPDLDIHSILEVIQ